jgi:HD domain
MHDGRMEKLGTLAWLESSGGKLALFDRLTLIAQGVRARAATRFGSRAKMRNFEVSAILPPDSALVREAVELSQAASEPWLFNHCLRSYFWARLLDRGTKFDDEALFVAFLLHDLGLTDAHRLKGREEQCFTVVGAREAERLAQSHGWSGRRARLAAEAIALHLNVVVGDEHGREAQMVREGSGADVAGLGLQRLERDQIDAVVKLHPRLRLKEEIRTPLHLEARERPDCRIAFLVRSLGFDSLIAGARPFTE